MVNSKLKKNKTKKKIKAMKKKCYTHNNSIHRLVHVICTYLVKTMSCVSLILDLCLGCFTAYSKRFIYLPFL